MTMTVTGTYESSAHIRNAREDLIANGIPQEQIFVDEENLQVKVMIADVTEPEIEKILKGHNAKSTTVTSR